METGMSAASAVSPFVSTLRAEIDAYCRSLDDRLPAYSYVPLTSDDQRLLVLQSRLYNEIRAAEVFGGWLRSTPELEVKVLLADAAHEEFGHASLLIRRLEERGRDPFAYTPPPAQVVLFNALEGLNSTVERLAAFPFAGEALASYLIRKALESPAVPDWIKEPYQKIGEEEEGHGDYPLELLSRYATTEPAQALVRRGVAIGIQLRARYFAELDEMVFEGRRW
jgi:1,2-phenylacetyl-CoA epoxidase catalytic subunit